MTTVATRNGTAVTGTVEEWRASPAARTILESRQELDRRVGSVGWSRRDLRIVGGDGAVVWEQPGVEFPESWSQQAAQIAASKYFWGTPGTDERETSFRQVLSRVVGTIGGWARDGGYFAEGGYDNSPRPQLGESLLRSPVERVGRPAGRFQQPGVFQCGLS